VTARAAQMRAGEVGEIALIARLRALLDRSQTHVIVPNGDDAACLQTRGLTDATVDSIVDGVDWLVGPTPPDAIGHRAAAVNLSDLAAMGATPTGLLLALELPEDADVDAVCAAAAGLAALADLHGVAVVGGDLGFCAGPQRWSVTALGQIEGPPLRRCTARPGDQLWLVGEVGRASLGLALLSAPRRSAVTSALWAKACVQRHLYPQPQVAAGRALQASGVRLAAIDVSDGLGLDACRLAQASGLALDLALPRPLWLDAAALNDCTALGLDWRAACAGGGDDYALLLSAPAPVDLAALLRAAGVDAPAQVIGTARSGPAGEVHLTIAGKAVLADGWVHGRSLSSH